MIQDLRFSVRLLLRNRGFATAAIITLGLGVGLNGIVFTLVRSVLLRPLPFSDPDRVVIVWGQRPTATGSPYDSSDIPQTSTEFLDWRAHSHSFDGLSAVVRWQHDGAARFDLIATDRAERLRGAFATPNFFNVLGVQAALGRVFTDADSAQSQEAVISDGLWRRAFGADRSVIGRTIRLIGGRPRTAMSLTVIGVLPPAFRYSYPDETELWTPLTSAMIARQPPGATFAQIVGRLRDGVMPAQASAELSTLGQERAVINPDAPARASYPVVVKPVRDQLTHGVRPQLFTIAAVALLVLLIACVNVGNLLLARTLTRSRELALRSALGATRRRLLRQLVLEVSVLGAASGGVGVVLATVAVPVWRIILPLSLPRGDEVRLDVAVLGFSFLAGFVSVFLGALAALILGTSNSIVHRLKQAGGTATSGRSAATWRRAVVAAQVAGVFVLLTASVLMLTSFWHLSHVDLGYDGRQVLTMEIRVLGTADEEIERMQRAILDAVQSVPGVTQAAMTSAVPLRGTDWLRRIALPAPSGATQAVAANIREVSPEYQAVMRIPILAGRWFDSRDTSKAPRVAVVSRSVATAITPSGRVLGRQLDVGSTSVEIVGVVGDVRSEAIVTDPRPAIYIPRAQDPSELMCLVLRTAAPNPHAPSLVTGIRAAIHRVAPDQPVERVTTLDEIASQSVADRRFVTMTTTAFAAVALILAIVGVVGVVSRSVSERTREIAVRVALGADGGRLRRMILGEAIRPVVWGIACGVLGGWWTLTLLRMQLFKVDARNPAIFVGTSALLLAVAVLAAYLPARACTRIDPISALRAE